MGFVKISGQSKGSKKMYLTLLPEEKAGMNWFRSDNQDVESYPLVAECESKEGEEIFDYYIFLDREGLEEFTGLGLEVIGWYSSCMVRPIKPETKVIQVSGSIPGVSQPHLSLKHLYPDCPAQSAFLLA